MTSDVVIRAEGLGKHYVLGHRSAAERDGTLRDLIVRSARAWGRSARDLARGQAIIAGDQTETFWALRDLNFEIRRGDVVGIIGRNGAGKSTLLKILSRITEPSEGRVTIDGRVASLLEVGTGFHPELTGRENIYLNGAILGMSRAEIRRKFDEIVDFAGVERFLDTPVKRYSSGMYVRLAFSVAAHLEPEILVVDEVLSVGDAEFQKKCLGKMRTVAGHGRTILFVSHDLSAVEALCNGGLLLSGGRIATQGTTRDVLSAYSAEGRSLPQAGPVAGPRITSCDVLNAPTLTVVIGIEAIKRAYENLEVRVIVSSTLGQPIGLANAGGFGSRAVDLAGDGSLSISVGLDGLASGSYEFTVEFIDRTNRRVHFSLLSQIVEINARILPGETHTLRGEFGEGYIRFPLKLHQERAVDGRVIPLRVSSTSDRRFDGTDADYALDTRVGTHRSQRD